jgi:voltage-gated potassium channel Kch
MSKKIEMSMEEARKVAVTFRLLAMATLGVLGAGVIIYQRLEGWTFVDSLYFSVVSLTTVGYGDIAPTTDAGKLFTVLYLLIGVGIIAAFLGNLFKGIAARRLLREAKIEEEEKSKK